MAQLQRSEFGSGRRMPKLFCFGIFCAAVVASLGSTVSAQTIQLPIIRTTQIRTAVSVPDGGSINLGGSLRQDIGFGGPNSSRRSSSRGTTQVSADVLIMKELEQRMLASSRPALQAAATTRQAINGSPQVRAKADFITRNVNRFKTRR